MICFKSAVKKFTSIKNRGVIQLRVSISLLRPWSFQHQNLLLDRGVNPHDKICNSTCFVECCKKTRTIISDDESMMVLSSQSILEKQLVCWFTFHITRRDCKGELSIENTVHHHTHTLLGYSCLISDTSELLRVKVHITGSADFYMDNV